jgi:leucyl/phenylalanyl-tRNA--protein transferase
VNNPDFSLPWLLASGPPTQLPDPQTALTEPNGLLAAGGALTPPWLRYAYAHGIFPWFSEGEPILWWSPDPRCVLHPERVRHTRSLGQSIRNRGYTTTMNLDFAGVMRACAAPRAQASGTWITEQMQRAYLQLHQEGQALSVETWHNGTLVGGLYGVQVGGLFCGESMFATSRDASKVALAWLAGSAQILGISLIDCQLPNNHLLSLGCEVLSRSAFLGLIPALLTPTPSGTTK